MFNRKYIPRDDPNSPIDRDAELLAQAILDGVDAEYAMAQMELLGQLDHALALQELEAKFKKDEGDHA